MSKLYARINSDSRKKQVTSRGFHSLSTKAETWNGIIETVLDEQGEFTVYASGKNGQNRTVIAAGNVDKQEYNTGDLK